MKRVLVTGGGGFIGRETLGPLRALGFEVDAPGRAELDLLNGDPAAWFAAHPASHLLHLAWDATPGKFWTAPSNLDWVAASLRLVRAFAVSGGTRAVVAGSCAEYDWGHATLDETRTPLRPATLYGTAKANLFELLDKAAPGLDLSFAWGRVFFPYGPDEAAGRLLPDVIDGIAQGRRVAVSDGTQSRDFMHVEDVGAAFATLLAGDVTGAVNIASGTTTPVREVILTAAAHAGDASLLDWGARARQASEPQYMAAATARLHATGFVPRWPLADGLADTVARRLAR
ncbi:NAD-dependent epimerase/dehydratase family protein [Glacieibacterium frigidum]|uniref:NAD(P)-dependent oxidoreductase n=1 Tax=Glacieibacterium frigidum TaxID=2593303 RepID=A0A552U9I0_9SPHN|nr:NAD(P)-dependent oxidoreductase [Glacieibacterium frigidum]TRW14872.1 NAD(P)-dependent oxidoreductase [Glacieibacterium frigidum]